MNDAELKLTAVVYCKHGAAIYLKSHGRLPKKVGGPWSVIPMRLALEERGSDPVLTADESLVYEALVREGTFPGGVVRIVSRSPDS